jgi:mRNA interferase HigB
MRVIKPVTLKRYGERYREAAAWLEGWLAVAKAASWENISDVRKAYRSADAAVVESGSTVTIFSVKGNKYRLIVAIHYESQRIYIRDFMAHAEYDSQAWKRRH